MCPVSCCVACYGSGVPCADVEVGAVAQSMVGVEGRVLDWLSGLSGPAAGVVFAEDLDLVLSAARGAGWRATEIERLDAERVSVCLERSR